MDLKDKRILVTGANGFIGINLTKELLKLGLIISVFSQDESKMTLLKEELGKEGEKVNFLFGDLRNYSEVRKAVEGQEVIFHLGALISNVDSYAFPRDYFEVNSLGTLNLLIASKEAAIKKMVIISTSNVYGKPNRQLIDEDCPLNPLSPYAASKIAAEKFAESFYNSYNLPVCILRLFNVFGPHQSSAPIIPALICNALNNGKVKVSNIGAKRDFVYVKDIVNAIIKAAISDEASGKTINIGTGEVHSIQDVVDIICNLMKIDPKSILEGIGTPIEEEPLICDNTKAKEILLWNPKYSLEEGIKESIDYFTNLHCH